MDKENTKAGSDGQGRLRIEGNLDWDGLHRPRIYYAMAATFCGLFLAVLDGTICNVALPSMASQLGVASEDSIWIVNAFQLAVMMLLLPFASMGELWGYKQVYERGIVVFTFGSLLCALSPSFSAAILAVAPWPWLFAINVPVGILTFVMARKHLPDNPVRVVGRTFNWREAVLNAATFGLFIGCVEAYSHDVEPLIVLLGAVAMVAVGFVYVRMQLGKKYPMLPLDLLKIPIFTTSVATSVISFTAQMLVMVGMPFMLVTTFGYNAVGTGLLMTSWPLAIIFVAPLAGWLVGRVHPGILGGIGLSMLSVGCFLLSFIPADTDHFGLVWRLMLCGAGFGFFQSPNNHLLLSSAPPQRAGSASGMLATARLTGQTLGAALVAMLFHLFGPMAPHDAMLLAGCLTVCGAVCSCLRLKERMAG